MTNGKTSCLKKRNKASIIEVIKVLNPADPVEVVEILSPGVRDPLGGIENPAPAYKIKKDVEEEFRDPPKTDPEREFMETFYDLSLTQLQVRLPDPTKL